MMVRLDLRRSMLPAATCATILLATAAGRDARATPSGTIALPDGFTHQPIASGVTNPTSFAFLPDGRVLVVEQKPAPPASGTGAIHLVVGGVVEPILTISNVATTGNEQGLLGVAVDPEWPSRPFVYVHFTHVQGQSHVRRYTASGELDASGSTSLALAEPYEVLVDIPSQIEFHNGGTLRFGPDGMLYVSQGDDATDTCAELQDPSNWKGVILRLDVSGLPTGAGGPPPTADLVPPDNPFAGPDEAARLTYAIGFRNPFRFTIDPTSGMLYVGDVGEDAWEELDEVAPGENYGWPLREGAHDFPPGAGCPGGAGIDPIAEYAHGVGPAAIIAGPRYRSAGAPFDFGAAYDGDVFYLAFYEGWVRRLTFDGAAWQPAAPVPGQPTPESWATGLTFVSDLQQGPDGALYYVRRFADSFFGRIVATPTVAVDPDPAPEHPARLGVTPSPATGGELARVAIAVDVAGVVEVSLYDVTGRRIRTVLRESLDAGAHEIAWTPRNLEPGVYFLRLETEGSREVVRLPVVR